ncbi:DsrE family protein [Thermithiobacillus tepidarius DSM 3134]|uniref:DsrE family protein n=1 Tax=Thermithiobacillus tepidarius TaxID=929 RepID=UPI000420ACB4|nr:DsrE family protein [Thermithiobacillus tepidarius]
MPYALSAVLLSLFLAVPARAATPDEIDAILARGEAPAGVVFEIVDRDPQALRWAIPTVRAQAQRLRQRWPGLPLAVVTHGNEQFALQKSQRAEQREVHAAVQALSREDKVPVHVCETYANRRGVAAEDFPDYVNVAAAGPAQIRQYQELGYVHVRVRRPASTSP